MSVTFIGSGEAPASLEILATPDQDSTRTVRAVLPRGDLEARLPAAKHYQLNFVLDGWVSNQTNSASIPADAPLAVEVTLPHSPSLQVLDAETMAPLPKANVLRRSGVDYGRSNPADQGMRREAYKADAAGSITLPRTATEAEVWVGAPGYVWARVTISPEDVGRRVLLARAGELDVVVQGVVDWDSLCVVATSAEGNSETLPGAGPLDSDATFPLRATDVQGRYRADDLPPGAWRVAAGWCSSRGIPRRLQEILAEGEAQVRVGESTELRLTVDASVAARGAVTLELVVPESWAVEPTISLAGVGERTFGFSSSTRGLLTPPGTWRAELKRMPPGPYQLSVNACNFTRLVRVGTNTTLVRVEVPPPTSLRTRVIDERTGATIAGARVQAQSTGPFQGDTTFQGRSPSDPEGSEGGISRWSREGTGTPVVELTGEALVRVPAGRTTLWVSAPDYLDARTLVDVPYGRSEFTTEIRLSRGARITVRVMRETRIAAWAKGEYVLEDVIEGGSQSGGFDANPMRLDGLAAGKYRLRLRVDGVVPELVQEVEVRADEEKTVDLELPEK